MLADVYENEIWASQFRDNLTCGEIGFCGAVTRARSPRHRFHMKKILILSSLILSAATVGLFADDSAPMPSVTIPASPAAPAAQPQTPATPHAKGKHKGKKHKRHQKKTENKKTDTTTESTTGAK